MKFESLELHDSTIYEIKYLWGSRELTLKGTRYSQEKSGIIPFSLLFKSVSSYSVQHNAPWGESSSINGTGIEVNGQYLIELQSGDVISVVASEVEFEGV
ncbi:hypothetical protein [Teredinibacter turnerae]|uniref:hypothetical protein n=1 Tax=Teredinibacter turnerae TaxID=2426 RepID=UPI0012BD0476|nr:hypothetical protein [Teredinibacter turnerae]